MKLPWLSYMVLLGILIMVPSACAMYGVGGHARPAKMNPSEFYTDKKTIALVRAAAKGDVKRIDALVAEGVDVNARGKDGFTPILGAMMRLNLTGVTRLLYHGANPNLPFLRGHSVIELAAQIDDPRFLQVMLENGGDPNYVNPKNGFSLLHEAINSFRLRNVELLAEHGANLDVQDLNGYPPTIFAADVNQYHIVYYLFQHGADYSIKDHFGKTIVWSIETGGIDPNSEAYQWRSKVVQFLRNHGVTVHPFEPGDPNPFGEKGPPPFS